MFQQLSSLFYWLIGIEQKIYEISTFQMVTRTIIVYAIALLLIRIGKRRFLGGYSAFDILMGFVVGSILSRTITGRENLFSASVVILTLMLIHYVISYLTFNYSNASKMLKNSARQLVRNGEIDMAAMELSKLGDNDLLQAIRQKGSVESIEGVESAYLERDGSITVIPKRRDPTIIEVKVEKGVQVVRLEVG